MSRAHPVFVVHEHQASRHHYDLRLEVDGVLASWAVPKGPSTDPREKRLAVRVEDHDLDYGDFEGRIESGYGAGAVIVWDTGPLTNETRDDDGEPVALGEALRDGHARVRLEGDKLRGAWVLQHAQVGGDPRNWLFVKVDDDGADARRNPTSTEPRSVKSGRTVAEVAAENAPDGP